MFNKLFDKKQRRSSFRNQDSINVHVNIDGHVASLSSADFEICFHSSVPIPENSSRCDFAVWAFLPLAMATGRNLHINGVGRQETAINAERLSEIWSSWVPSSYTAVNVSFSKYAESITTDSYGPDLLLFSGGIDATHTLITRDWSNGRPNLLTVHGLEYKHTDSRHFSELMKKTSPIVDEVGNNRLIVKTDAYSAYRLTTKTRRLTFVFVLAASGFLHMKNHRRMLISSDYDLYQQFEAHPYASSSVTNPLFSSEDYKLITVGDNITRAEKLLPIFESQNALKSLSMCYDKKIIPHNCGKCIKCIRTKYMFLASVGKIPDQCFLNQELSENKKMKFSKYEKPHRSFVFDAYYTAKRHGNLEKIPDIVKEYHRLKK